MKVGTKLQFEVPDDCPEDCKHKGTMGFQGDACSRCPVFNCKGPGPDADEMEKMCLPVLEPNEYRDDWAEEWVEFFKTGKEPDLWLVSQS